MGVRPSNGDTASLASRPGLPSSASAASTSTVVSSSLHVQTPAYQAYPSGPPLGPPPPAPWMHPSHLGGVHRPPFVPYPGGFPGPFPVPPRPLGLPQAHVPNASQPPGTAPLGPPGGAPTSKCASGQALSNWGAPLPPGVSQPISLPPQRVDVPGQVSTTAAGTAQTASLKPVLIEKEKQGNEHTNKEAHILKNVEVDSWTAHKTEAGAVYYYNALTGESTYEKPLGFKGEEMLKEKGVAPFSKWEKELPKIIFDPRFKDIPSYTERRSIFEHYVRTRADEERKEKRAELLSFFFTLVLIKIKSCQNLQNNIHNL